MPATGVGQSNAAPAFYARGLSKTYVMGEVEAHAQRSCGRCAEYRRGQDPSRGGSGDRQLGRSGGVLSGRVRRIEPAAFTRCRRSVSKNSRSMCSSISRLRPNNGRVLVMLSSDTGSVFSRRRKRRSSRRARCFAAARSGMSMCERRARRGSGDQALASVRPVRGGGRRMPGERVIYPSDRIASGVRVELR